MQNIQKGRNWPRGSLDKREGVLCPPHACGTFLEPALPKRTGLETVARRLRIWKPRLWCWILENTLCSPPVSVGKPALFLGRPEAVRRAASRQLRTQANSPPGVCTAFPGSETHGHIKWHLHQMPTHPSRSGRRRMLRHWG